jgi:hypothetical protein
LGGIVAGLVAGMLQLPRFQKIATRMRSFFESADSVAPPVPEVNEERTARRLVEKKGHS